MKRRISTCFSVMVIFAAAALPARLAAPKAKAASGEANLRPCRIAPKMAVASAGGENSNSFAESGARGTSCRRNCRHYGYCEATYTKGQWLTDGLCTSHNFSFCDIQPSSACPNGATVKQLTSDSCGGFGSDEVDLARTCSF